MQCRCCDWDGRIDQCIETVHRFGQKLPDLCTAIVAQVFQLGVGCCIRCDGSEHLSHIGACNPVGKGIERQPALAQQEIGPPALGLCDNKWQGGLFDRCREFRRIDSLYGRAPAQKSFDSGFDNGSNLRVHALPENGREPTQFQPLKRTVGCRLFACQNRIQADQALHRRRGGTHGIESCGQIQHAIARIPPGTRPELNRSGFAGGSNS